MKNILFYKKEAKYFEEALPLGNGRIGGLVFGNLKKERIALNEDTLWSGYPKDLNKKDAYKYLDSARQAIFGGKIDKANEIVNKDMHGHWSESYLPFGDIIINYKGVSKRNYKRTLDISKGIAVAESDGFKETVFISHPAQLMVINIHSDSKISFKVKFKSQLKSKTKAVNDAYVINGKAPDTIWPLYHREGKSIVYGDKGMNFCGAIKVIGNAEITDRYIKVKKQNDITLLVSLATSFIDFKSMPNADSEKRAFAYLENTKSYKELLDEHTDDFSSLFDRVDFELDGGREDLPTDKRIKEMNKTGADYGLIALLFQFGRYLTISGSRPGTVAMNLQGIWNTHLHAPWSSNFTANINTEMNYWCTDIANLSECFEPLTAHVKKLAENGRITAHDYYNCRGFCAHHNNDIWGMTRPAGYPKGNGNSTQYAPWCMSGPWFLNQLYEHYLYTADENYKEEIRPLFEECLAFFKDFLVEHNGELVTCPSISPENSYKLDGKSYSLSYMTTMDRGILIEFLKIAGNSDLKHQKSSRLQSLRTAESPNGLRNMRKLRLSTVIQATSTAFIRQGLS